MWKNIYDSILQSCTGITWTQFMHDNGAIGTTVRNKFFSSMYPYAGIYLLFFSIITCIVYYYYFNARFGNYYTQKIYYWNMFINSLLIGLSTFITGKVVLGAFICPTTPHVIWLSIINFFYGAILFFGISILIKWKSPMAKRTPF